jgi:stage V sporulation protein R
MLPDYLDTNRLIIRETALRAGLDFYEVVFELLDYRRMNEVASYEGFPKRYPHWRFGMEFERNFKMHGYGLAKIYELVINNDPCYAYLLEGNSMLEQRLVMAHVYGHCDFFKNNAYFGRTDRKMVDSMANHGVRIRRYMDIHGIDRVEQFIDGCLSLDNLVDPFATAGRKRQVSPEQFDRSEDDPREKQKVGRLKVERSYMEEWINPEEYVEEQRKKLEEKQEEAIRFPLQPERDVLGFLMENAPLARWERHVLGMQRQEALYFLPQRQTKIMNEGWASYWHSKLMTEKLAGPSEIVDFAETHSATMSMSPGQINPYKIGLEIFRDIEDRWNRGKFGPEWEACDDLEMRANWNRHMGLGQQKIFEVRRIHNDVTFIDEFLTTELIDRLRLYNYKFDQKHRQWVIESRDPAPVRESLLFQLTNSGQPVILVVDANYKNRGELLLRHRTDTIGLDQAYAKRTLGNIQSMWKRPVNVATVDGRGKEVVWTHDGKEFGKEGS